MDFSGGVYWNGAIHWVSPREASLYFDLSEETVREMLMPSLPDGFDERGIRYFGESLGHLHIGEIYTDFTSQLNVYEMERDRSGWFLKFRVDLNGVAVAFPDLIEGYLEENEYNHYSFSILCVVRGEKEEDSFLLGSIPMWPCLPQGERPPLLLRRFFQPCFLAALKASFQPCLLAVFKDQMFLCFSLLQVPINRQATEEHPIPHHSNPKVSFCNPIEREPRELKRGEKNRE